MEARRRRLLAEVEDHLREAAARLEHDGASPGEAARLAVAQFGAPRDCHRPLRGISGCRVRSRRCARWDGEAGSRPAR